MQKLSQIRRSSEKKVAIRVTPAAERSIKDGHPWLFADSIRQQSHEGESGDLAVIFDRKNRFLAIGLYDPNSPIRVRILQNGKPAAIDRSWFANGLENAAQLRLPLQAAQTNGYRMVHGENDRFPGLVIDRYADTLVIKLYSLIWMPYLSTLIELLCEQQDPRRVVLRLGRLVQKSALITYGLADGDVLFGPPVEGIVVFQENGLSFEADLIQGQKTGFFLDQRDNRKKVEKLSVGMDVLNVFAYTGGFSVYAARGGAKKAASLDLSQPALDAAQRNFQRNQSVKSIRSCEHELIQGDAFILLNQLADQGRRFDLLILDPPAFAQSKAQISRALGAYFRLNSLGLALLKPNGILVSASCSSRISAEDFFATVYSAADKLGRQLSEIERTGHALDHPIGFREGSYLKCLFARAG